jgi:pyruvate kinase
MDSRFRGNDKAAISSIAGILAREVTAKAIVVATLTGATGREVSRFRPELPIYVATDNDKTLRQLILSWAVVPFKVKKVKTIEELLKVSVSHLKEKKLVKSKDKVIIIGGDPVGEGGATNLVEIREI